MNKPTLSIRLLVLFLFLSCCLHAQQNPHPHFRHYGTEHGLPSPEVYCVLEDRQGYMWFGTDNGASRFDGYTFKNYGPKEGLMSNAVLEIREDGNGRIWFGTFWGPLYVLDGDTILPYKYNHIIESFRSKWGGAYLAHVSEEGGVCVVLNDYGLLRIHPQGVIDTITGSADCSTLAIDIAEAQRTELVMYRYKVGSRDSAYIWKENAYRLSRQYSEFYSEEGSFRMPALWHPLKPGTVGEKPFAQRLPSGEWLFNSRGRLHCIKDTQIIWTTPFFADIEEVIPEENGALWFCAIKGGGLRRYDDLEALKNSQFDLFLDGITITNFLKTSQNEYWVTTHEGVFYTPNRDILVYDSKFGLSEDFVSTLAFKDDAELFIGCNNGDIFNIDTQQGRVTTVFSSSYGHHNFDLWYDEQRKRLWGSGGYREGGRWHSVPYWHSMIKQKLPPSLFNFKKIQLSSKGELTGVYDQGFLTIDIENDSVTSLSHFTPLKGKVYALHTDKTNRLWVGRHNGLFQVSNEAFISPGLSHPPFHHRVEDIHEYPDTTLVLGTKGYGVLLWKDTSIVQITTQEGLASDMLEDVHVDENGTLWAATLSGLSKISRRPGAAPEVRTFTMGNGLPSNEIYQIKSHKGQVWLCTAGGLVKFKERPQDTTSRIPILEVVKANKTFLEAAGTPSLPYDENNLEFQFLAINYRMGGRIPYRYRLQPDAPWQYTQNRAANYPALPPDEYEFEVQAQNEDGYWSSSASFAFTVLPPWWASWWFRALAGLGIAAAGYVFYRYRIRQLQRENALQQQMAALEKSALQAQMNPHFIFNCLNSIQNFILQNDKKKAVEYLSRFAKLVRHNLNASVRGQVTLEEEITLLDNYLALERERFSHRFDYEIEVAESLKGCYIQFPPLLIQPYVENAVIHGLSNKAEGGFVKIRFYEKEGAILASIKDNGAGYRQNEQGQKEQHHKSVGMSITRKRLELLGADPEHSVQISSGDNDQPTAPGTEVNILINVKTNNAKLA